MECNKDEAIRARDIAQMKMQNNDFAGAKRFALKAQQLYANLDSISMILAVCEVHCSAQNKMIGSAMDWYEVLQVEKITDEATIKKQYRKLALLLHPDKNKFAGAEAAFKLIGEANRVLSDKIMRSAFDMKVKASMKISASLSKPPFQPSSGSSSANKQIHRQQSTKDSVNQQSTVNGPRQKPPIFRPDSVKFWTRCPHCRTSFEYCKPVLGRQLSCQTCRTSFIAYETDAPGPANRSNADPTQPECFTGKRNVGSSHKGPEAAGRASEFNGGFGGHSARNSMPVPPTKTGFSVSNSKQKGSDVEGGTMDVQKKGPKSDVRKPVTSASRNTSKKRGRMRVEESSHNPDGVGDVNVGAEVNQENGCSKQEGIYDAKRPGLNKKNVSRKRSLYDESEFAKSPKLPETAHTVNMSKKEAHTGKGLESDHGNAFATTVNGFENVKQDNEASDKVNVSKGQIKLKKQSVSSLEEDKVDHVEESDSDIDPGNSPVSYDCLDPEFSDFDKDKEHNCFDVDQLWAVYDTVDAMPRFYARVRKVYSPDFKLQITWLEPDTQGGRYIKWIDEGLPVACGLFKYGTTVVTTDRLMFSHQMHFENGKKRFSFMIYPRAGEIWAIFRNWDISWADDPEKHKPYKFEFVVILSDFDEKEGVEVVYLQKLRGFVSLFQQSTLEGRSSFRIPSGNLLQFSHRVPSFLMSGIERDDVPAGSYELDTASLPNDVNEVVDFADEKKESACHVSCKQSTESLEKMTAFSRVEGNGSSRTCCQDDANPVSTSGKNHNAFSKDGQSFFESGTAASNQDIDFIASTRQEPATFIRRSPRGSSSLKNSNVKCEPYMSVPSPDRL
uniref:J domain-containing protein n=1 Tax=Kalanchoe fedtschenkoi TaxID=63787 RepID=A0A7N0TX18_KALFE